MKNSGIAAVLSFFIPGLGQLYNGQFAKFFLFFGLQTVNWLLTFIVIGYLFIPVVWLWGMIDAYRSAEKINRQSQMPV